MDRDDVFDEVVGDLDYPMLVVTASAGGERSGCLVGFATQCGIDPARYLVCISVANHTYRVAARADTLVVHFLAAGDRALAELFGGRSGDDVDKFAAVAWRDGPGGAPVLTDVRRWFGGRVLERLPLGDHVGFVLEPLAGRAEPWPGQLAFQSVKEIKAGHPA